MTTSGPKNQSILLRIARGSKELSVIETVAESRKDSARRSGINHMSVSVRK